MSKRKRETFLLPPVVPGAMTPEFLQTLRDAIAAWAGLRGKLEAGSKPYDLLLTLGEDSIVRHLQPLVPDPRRGDGDLMLSMVGTAATIFGLDKLFAKGNVTIWVGDPDQAMRALLDERDKLETSKRDETSEARLAELRELTADYILEVPYELYEKACERNRMEWLISNGDEMAAAIDKGR